jgi:hypothetical protein
MLARILLTGLLMSTLIFAQGKKGGGGSKGPDLPNVGMGGSTRLDRISEMLKLNKDQKKDLKATFDDSQKEATPVHDQMAKSRQAIGDAIAGGKSQDEIAKEVAAEAQLEAQMIGIELRAFAKVALALDEDQKQRAGMLFGMMRGMFSGKNWNSLDQ